MQPGKTFSSIFYVRSLSGNVLSADSAPVCTLIRNGIDTVVVTSVAQLADSAYLSQSLIPSNWVDGDVVHLRINATSSGLNLTETKVLGVVSANAGSFNSNDRAILLSIPTNPLLAGNYTAPSNAGILNTLTMVSELYKRQGLYNGITAIVRDAEAGVPGVLETSDGSIMQSLVKVGDSTEVSRLNATPTILPLDANSGEFSAGFSWGNATPSVILQVAAGTTVFVSQLTILTAFNGTSPILQLGDSANPGRLISASQNNPTELGSYGTSPVYTYLVATEIILSIVAGSGCTQGSGIVLLEIN